MVTARRGARPTRATESRPIGVPPASTTTSGSAPSVIISESASRSVVEPGACGCPPGGSPFSGSSSISSRRRRARRFRPRSAPTKRATKSSAGCARIRSGVSYWPSVAALAQDRDPVAELDRLVDVVRDEDHRLAHLLVQAQELELEAVARDRVERAERLVHQHQRRVDGERAGEADALSLAARELGRIAVGVLRLELPTRSSSSAVRSLIRARGQPSRRGTVRDVLGDGHVREEPDLLDHVADPAAQLGHVVVADARPVDADVAVVELDQAVDHLHRGRLARAGRARRARRSRRPGWSATGRSTAALSRPGVAAS